MAACPSDIGDGTANPSGARNSDAAPAAALLNTPEKLNDEFPARNYKADASCLFHCSLDDSGGWRAPGAAGGRQYRLEGRWRILPL